ncbi:MFS transporter [Rhodococcus sp. T2V]|uniref:MFS transporter n=1 Tax=Rhodococcus sp. T2V TaxID=3034164 RepID=UPI0023E1B0A9|nr:MFS transporter [Rhodococcus sp. T2V]MDF3305317.1 MFS transporter [Rhodococcus sp. T2V]
MASALDSAVAKIFRRVVPLFAIMMMCNQLNRSNIGYAQTHLEADLGIGAAAYGLGAGLFFIAYTVFELPSNMLMERFGAKVWLSRICVSWGLVSAAMIFTEGTTSFYVLRFLLGVAEAGFVPAVLYYLTKWLPNSHRGRANARYAVGALIAFTLSGPLSGPLLSLNGFLGLAGWQWLFLIEGSMSVVIGVFAYFRLDSKITDAKWLTESEQNALIGKMTEEEALVRAEYGEQRPSMWSVLKDPRIALFVIIYFATQMSIYANTFWLPSIVRNISGTNDITVGLLSSLPWICAIVMLFTMARLGDRTGQRRRILICLLLISAAGSYLAGITSPWVALGMLCIAAMGFKSISPIFWPIVQKSIHPMTVGIAIALINALANLGGFVAPYGFGLIKEHTGSTQWGLFGLALASVVAAGCCLLIKDKPTPVATEIQSTPKTALSQTK